jgi:(2R)-3-sulfolactate dehydrogenase (NADP+)
MAETDRISLSDATDLLTAAFVNATVPEDTARCVARALVAAEAEGQVGHGFSRLGDYIAQVQSGKINATAPVAVQHVGPASLRIDAGLGFAYPAMEAALEAGIPLAQETGIVIMGIANSHHCGALSIQVEKIAQAGLIGLMVANAPKAIAPWGAKQPLFGTNPIAFAVPQAGAEPLVVDLSLSKVARGKVMAAKKAGTQIPPNWALDVDGNPTTDPDAALAGTMVPIGEAKGTALALMVEILAAAFTGSAFSHEAGSFFHADGPAPRVGQTIIAIRPEGGTDFLCRVRGLLDEISGMEGARLPGSRRRAAIAAAQADGLLVPAHLLDLARSLARTA